MDVISSMIYEVSFRGTIVAEVERYCKGKCKCWLDKQNDSFKVSILDVHNRPWQYEEYDLSYKLNNGVSAYSIAHNAIRAYEKKIFREFFK